MNTLDVLVKARGYVERGWCQEWFAKDAGGKDTASTNPLACSWCAMGAINVACGGNADLPAWLAARDLLDASIPASWVQKDPVKPRNTTGFNDTPGRTQAEVLALFDMAIGKAKEVRP